MNAIHSVENDLSEMQSGIFAELERSKRGSKKLTHCVIKAERSGIPFMQRLCVLPMFQLKYIQISLNCRSTLFQPRSIFASGFYLEKFKEFHLFLMLFTRTSRSSGPSA